MSFLDKMKNLFTDEIEEEPIKSEVIQVEIPSPLKEEKKEDENIADNNAIKNEEKVSAPIFFDDEYFKELEQPKQETKFNSIKEQPKIKEEKKIFKPTPIISPVYGVLDKNYSKEDITTKTDKQMEKTNTAVTIDEVRKKAFGTLEDELENTLFSSNSILFNDEIKDETKEDLFDELIDVDEDIIRHASKDDSINIVEEELSKTIDKPLNEGELFDLIDSMYERGE